MSYILPLMILGLIIYALIKRVDIYSAFTEGAAEALPMLIRILPYMAGMLAAIQALRASGALELMLGALSPAFNAMGLPAELAPLFILRPFSGSAALSLLGDVLTTYGPDTFTGVAASIMLGSTETIFHRALFRHGWHTPHARGIARGTYKLRYRYGGGDSPCARTICIMGQVML